MVRLAQGAFLSLGWRSTYTDAVAGAAAGDLRWWYRVTEGFHNLTLEREQIEFSDLSTFDPSINQLVAGKRRWSGSVTFRVTYDKLADLMRLITGHNATIGAGPAPYLTTYTPVDYNGATHWSHGSTTRGIIAEVNQGHANSVYYYGGALQSAEFRFEAGGIVECTLELIGRNYVIAAKTATVTYGTNYIAVPSGQAGRFLDLGGTQYICRSATVRIGHGLEERSDLTDTMTLLPFPGALREVTLEAEIEMDDETLLAKVDDPKTNRFTSGYVQISDQSAGSYDLKITFNELVVQSPVEARASSIGQVVGTIRCKAMADATGAAAYGAVIETPDAAYATGGT